MIETRMERTGARPTPRAWLAAVALLAILLGVGSSALAEETTPRRTGGVIRLEEITIEGRVQKPQAFYVLQRSSLGFELTDVQQSFVREVVESVQHDPF